MTNSASSGVFAWDNFDPVGSEYMRDVFPDVVERDSPKWSSWKEEAVGFLVGTSALTGEDIRSAKKLKFIVRHGVGYDKVDVEACKEKGVVLCNCPGVNVGPSPSLRLG